MNNIKTFFKKLFNSRSLKYGSNSIILTAVVVAIAVIINVLVVTMPDKLGMAPLKLDLTSNKLYSVGDTTKDILKSLQKDVTIYGMFDDGAVDKDYKDVTDLLSQYKKYAHIKVEYVDPDKNPGFIKKIDPDNLKSISKNDFVVISGKKLRKLSYYDLFQTQMDQQSFQQYKTGSNAEQSFTGAIKYVTSDVTPAVYFIEGHEERKVDSDYKTVKDYLERNNYDVKSLNLTTEAKIPDDAEIIIVASPKKDLTTSEKDKLNQFLGNGGKAVFLFDSLEANPNFAQFEDVLKNFNVSLNYDKVKESDTKRFVPPNKYYDILPDLQQNSINSGLDPNIIMPVSRSLNVLKNQKEYITVTSMMKTSAKAVGEQIDKSKKDITGPLDLAISVENNGGAKPSKIIVIGNSSFITDAAMNQYQRYSVNGMYFFLNSLSWMQDKKDDVLIAPKNFDNRTLTITQNQAAYTAIAVVILLPLIILGFGTFVWMRRRHL